MPYSPFVFLLKPSGSLTSLMYSAVQMFPTWLQFMKLHSTVMHSTRNLLLYKLNTTVVLFQSVTTNIWVSGNLGTPSPPSFTPSIFTGFTDQMIYVERLMNFFTIVLNWAVMKVSYYPRLEAVYCEHFSDTTIPSNEEIERNASIVLANSHVSITRPRALMPDIIDVGGLHLEPAKPLPKLANLKSSFKKA